MRFKDSGIEWLGEIPEHWEVRRLKFLAEKIISGGTPNTSIQTYWADELKGSYLWVAIEDITESEFIQDTKKYITKEGLQSSTAKLIPPYSILYSIYASLGKVAYSDKILTTNQAILAIQTKDSLFYKFLFYFLSAYTRYVTILASMTTQINISLFIVQNISIPLPPIEEQRAIAEYLDKKCDKISQFIESKQKLIALLSEKKQALINAVVCRGLNKNTELKESGVKYLGTIPKHWEVRKLKYLAYIKGRIGFHGLKSNEFQYNKGAYLVTGNDFFNDMVNWDKCRRISEERYYEDSNIHLRNDDLLITKDGTIGKTAIVKACPTQATLNSGVLLVRVDKLLCFVKYLFYVINSQYFKEFIISKTCGSTIIHLYQSDFNELKSHSRPYKSRKQSLLIWIHKLQRLI